ncbi:uncharacterized protein YmfQ (DUF2313 family) [Paucimonas lemoignei]|uniref:Uncharacterized protein YmfQ (DUF2313 family) n=1 Tax=Paucimonas lemoignei TaxID=29443 RepID=A0A4R3HRQ4_PAULE|nr:putative phage tail protein [Paucimonas lemoignei]TCS35806.1 uncharacterized protein YmfQ (DUF2313 family) [Paucimonas lemoignei]
METLDKDQYASAHAQLQPRGLAWSRNPNGVLGKLYKAFSRSYASVHASLLLLARELDPRSSSQLLDDWERFAGLPDECSLIQGTESERRAAVHAKITATGGASASYFIQLAATLGYPGATVTEFPVARFGRSHFGDRFHSRKWRNVWQLNLPGQGNTTARFGDRFGTRFQQSGNTVLECRVVKLKPAHTQVIFHYGA